MNQEADKQKDILGSIRHIEIHSRRLVESLFSGEYHSVFKGSGIEFAEVRPYQEGDDIRSIDWNVTARTGSAFVKVYEEERELTVILMVDISASGGFGTVDKFKSETLAQICATIAFSAIKNSDKVGLFMFSDTVELYIPPSKSRKHVLRIIREILFFTPQGKKTDIKAALERLNSTIKKKAIVFLLSDFDSENFQKPLQISAKKHDVIAVEVFDPAERKLPDAGLITLQDAETGEEIIVDSSNEDFRRQFDHSVRKKNEELEKLFSSCGIDHISAGTDRPPVEPLVNFFRERGKRNARMR